MWHKDPAGLAAFPRHCTGSSRGVFGSWLACPSPSTLPGDSATFLGSLHRLYP